MDFCKYHPVKAATFRCNQCDVNFCDHCVEHTDDTVLCCICSGELESLGAGHDITPFWRRLDKAFRYPMNQGALLLIVCASLISSFGAILGGITGFLLGLIITAITTKYSFLCLQKTANGSLECPDIRSAYSGGLKIIVHFILIFIVISAMIFGFSNVFGETATNIFSLLWIFSLPAVFIIYARHESILDAVNPLEITRFIIALGGSYLLLLVFLGIMAASVGTLNHLLDEFYFFSTVMQSIVSYYYLVVVFHLMGYLLFQKQKQLGFVSRLDVDDESLRLNVDNQIHSRLDVLAKEGRFVDLEHAYREYIRSNPRDWEVFSKMMDYLESIRKYDRLDEHLSDYLALARDKNSNRQAIILYQKMIHQNPKYQPKLAEQRLLLAQFCEDAGKPALAVKLINGLHREHPGFAELLPAYTLMLKALSEMPGKEAQAGKCKQLIDKLIAKSS